MCKWYSTGINSKRTEQDSTREEQLLQVKTHHMCVLFEFMQLIVLFCQLTSWVTDLQLATSISQIYQVSLPALSAGVLYQGRIVGHKDISQMHMI